MLVYSGMDSTPIGYTDSDFQTCRDSRKSTSGCVFGFGGIAIVWRSVKQTYTADPTMEASHYKRTKHIDQKYYIIREAIGK